MSEPTSLKPLAQEVSYLRNPRSAIIGATLFLSLLLVARFAAAIGYSYGDCTADSGAHYAVASEQNDPASQTYTNCNGVFFAEVYLHWLGSDSWGRTYAEYSGSSQPYYYISASEQGTEESDFGTGTFVSTEWFWWYLSIDWGDSQVSAGTFQNCWNAAEAYID